MSPSNDYVSVARGRPGYEELRTRFANGRVPPAAPASISLPVTTADVVEAVLKAREAGQKIGVRSGGHLFPCPSLLEGGLLIDTKALNRSIDYDPVTHALCFGPAHTSSEIQSALSKVGRFFPFGHTGSVGVGGFLLAGGQGWFMRGWGFTADSWILKMEVVTADGKVVNASLEENQDLFWAARGSGQGFFGVLTKVWVRTIPAQTPFETIITFNCTTEFEKLLAWAFDAADGTPRYGTEVTIGTFYADKFDPGLGDEIQNNTILMVIGARAYASSLIEAKTTLSCYRNIPDELRHLLVADTPVEEKTWDQLFKDQDATVPLGNGERWSADNLWNDPQVPRPELIKAIKPIVCNLPSRRSMGALLISDYYPDENDSAISLPQQYFVSTLVCWTDPASDAKMRRWTRETYTNAASIAAGQYIADFDITNRLSKVMSASALQKWLNIRQKWDPEEVFPGYKGFASIVDAKSIKL